MINNFENLLTEKVNNINDIIKKYLPENGDKLELIVETMNYSVNAGGKRIRPMLIEESFQLFGGNDVSVVWPFMAAMEYIHTYSLVHDDLPAMDNDDYRRGVLTTHKKYGEDFGILAGDALLNYAFETILNSMSQITDSSLLHRYAKAGSILSRKSGVFGMVGGQSLDVYLTDKTMTEDELRFIFDNKTGALIEAAFMIGAVLAGAEDEMVTSIEKCGNLVGVAFQIQDDILDVTSTQDVLGKPVFSDEKNNKVTYVSLYGMEKAKSDVKLMSDEAVNIVKECGDNEFLVELIYRLINREK